MSFLHSKHKLFLIVSVALIGGAIFPFSALAIVYQPGETLNPACAPTDVNCGVAAPITASSTSALSLGGAAPEGSLFYVAGTSTLQNIIPAGNLLYSIGSPESRLQNVYTNNLILGSASFVMEDVGGVLRFRDVNSVVPGLVIDPSSGATINGNIFINGGATLANATTTGSHSIGGALVLGGASFQNLVGVGLKVASSTLALDNSGDWAGTFDGQEASYFLVNSFSTSSANSWLGGKTTGNLTEGSNLYWTTSRGNQNFTSNLSATTTDALAEGAANKYYTDARFDNRLALKTTSDLTEGSNLYWMQGRFDTAFSGKSTANLVEGANLYYTDARFDNRFTLKTTSGLTEGVNLYYTDARARNALSVSAPLSYSASTGFFSLATGDITAPSNPEITIGGGIGAIVGNGVTITVPEAGTATRGLVSTGTQTFAGDKTFSGNTALSGALNVTGASTLATSSINSLMVSGTSTLAGIIGTNLNIAGNTSLATTTAANLTLSSITPGSLLFAGAGGLISQNNSNLFWDNANSRLGVGTASPNARLYVKTSDLTSTPFYIEGQDNAFTGLSGWFYRKPVVIDNTVNSVSYSNQQTFVSINTADMISAGKLQSNCADLRFTNTDGTTILPHWVEYGCNSAGTGVWVQIPTLPAGITKTIYMYYGNATATSTSNGAGVFTFFDDFPTNQARFYNTEYSGWTVQTGSWIIPSGNYLTNYYGTDMITVNSPSAGIGSAVRAKMTEAAAWKYARLLIGWQDANNYYQATLNSGGGQLNIQKVVGGTQTTLSNINASVAAGTWYEVELRWISSTAIEAQIWDVNGNSLGVAQGAISEGWTNGKFGAAGSSGVSQARFENYMTLQYAPNLSSSIGAEESSGAPQQLPFFVVKNQTGKVGIGETNPGAKLSVSGGLAIGSDFDTTSVSDGNAIFSGRLGVGVVSPSNALTFAAGSVIDSQGALSVTTASNGALSLTSNGSGNIVIDSGSNGALNIGTGANGKIITLGNTTGATGLVFNSGSGNINFDGGTLYVDTVNNRVGIGTSTPAGTLHVANASSANALVVASSGNVGIGLSNPTDTLNIYGGIKTESTVGTIMTAGSDGSFAYNFGSGVSNSLSKRVAQSSDDAEQSLATNGVNLTSSDLELINDAGVDQEVGIRFQNITIPQGATITNAYIEFTVDGAHSGTTNLNFYGEAADNTAAFASATNNITSRTKTSATVAWSNVPAWTTIGQTQQTPNLTSIIQEIINRAGWLSGNSLAVIVNGTAGSLRRAVSYDGGASSAALLVVQYTTNSTNVSYAINNLGPGLFRINDEFNDASPFVVDSSGNVGIGTSTPSQKFHVSGGNIKLDWDKALVWRNAADSADAEVIKVTGINPNQNSLNLTIPGGPAADPSNARFVISADGSFYFRNNTPIDTMRLTSAGSLGIGTASPGAKLDVRNNDIAQLYLTNTLSGTQAHIGVGDAGTWGANNLVFSDVSNNPRFVVDLLNGNVGIGASSPGAKLHIVGISNTAGFLFDIADVGAAAVPFKIAGTDVGSASTVLSSTVLTNNTTGGNQNVMLIENAAGLGVTDALLKLNNADTDTAVVDGLLITSANGLITDAIDVSGTNITNAINIGGNKIVGDSLSIDGDGNVGIGTTTPAQLLHVARSTDGVVARFTDANGDCDINPTNTALVCTSDASLKKNVVTMDSTLEKTLALNPVIFDWNREEDGAGNHIGFIAQEVEELFPALVSTNEDNFKSIAYSNFAPILTKAIQEVASLADSFKVNLIAWFADATNGIADFFAKKIHTEQICLKKSDGNEYCINGDDLEVMINQKLSTSDVDNGAKEDVVLPEPQPQELIAEFFPTEIETVAATTTEEVTEATYVGLTKSYIGGSNPTSTELDILMSDSDSNQEIIIDFLPTSTELDPASSIPD